MIFSKYIYKSEHMCLFQNKESKDEEFNISDLIHFLNLLITYINQLIMRVLMFVLTALFLSCS